MRVCMRACVLSVSMYTTLQTIRYIFAGYYGSKGKEPQVGLRLLRGGQDHRPCRQPALSSNTRSDKDSCRVLKGGSIC